MSTHREEGDWQLLYAVLSHTSLPPHVQNMSQCTSHNFRVLTVVRLTTNYFWQQET